MKRLQITLAMFAVLAVMAGFCYAVEAPTGSVPYEYAQKFVAMTGESAIVLVADEQEQVAHVETVRARLSGVRIVLGVASPRDTVGQRILKAAKAKAPCLVYMRKAGSVVVLDVKRRPPISPKSTRETFRQWMAARRSVLKSDVMSLPETIYRPRSYCASGRCGR